ncbi:MAG: YmfQ family protein [Clostridium sp.]|nr:YmfQ family protein [Clostridium sp.]
MSETFNLEEFPASESALRMLSYVSDGFYDKSYVGKWLYQVMGQEYDTAREIIESLPAQMFPEAATWGLMYHEMKWGLPVRENLSYEERRRLIYQKRDYRSPITPWRMETYLRNATGFEVHIADASDPGIYGFVPDHPNTFKAYFIGEETLNARQVREILNRLKQSHTIYIINDRIEIVLDNREIERILLRNVRFDVKMPFWGCCVFDGGWLLDGSVILCEKRRYGLRLGLNNRIRIFLRDEISRLFCVKIGAVRTSILETLRAGGRNAFAVRTHEQGRSCVVIHAEMHTSVEKMEVSVTTKTPDYWYLDGSVMMDGSRRFNSVYREEDIE